MREKGESLGFTLVAHADSPVAGGSGAVEILAHLVFGGRSAKLPQPGESRGQKEAEPKRARDRAGKDDRARVASTAAETLVMFAVAAPGIEPVLTREVAALPGVRDVRAVAGGVEFAGDREVLYRANLWLRTATRVLVRVGDVRGARVRQDAPARGGAAVGALRRSVARRWRCRRRSRAAGSITPAPSPRT